MSQCIQTVWTSCHIRTHKTIHISDISAFHCLAAYCDMISRAYTLLNLDIFGHQSYLDNIILYILNDKLQNE